MNLGEEVSRVLDSKPDRFGRSPLLHPEAIEELRGLADALDILVYVGKGDDPRRPRFLVGYDEARLEAFDSSPISGRKPSC